jgi:hypothetical protein
VVASGRFRIAERRVNLSQLTRGPIAFQGGHQELAGHVGLVAEDKAHGPPLGRGEDDAGLRIGGRHGISRV